MKSFGLVAKLVLAQMRLHPGRAIITMVGVIASTCAVVWVVSGYDALVSQFDENSQKYLGRYDALVLPQAPPGIPSTIDRQVLELLRRDPGVLELNPINQTRVSVTKASQASAERQPESALGLLVGARPPVYGAPPIDPILVATPATEPPYELVEGAWLAAGSAPSSAVISQGAAEQVGVSVGDEVLITSLANQVRLKIVGIVEQAAEAPTLSGEGRARGGPRGRPKGGRRLAPGESDATTTTVNRSRSTSERASHTATTRESENSDSGEDTKPSISTVGIPKAFVQGPATKAVYVRPQTAEIINGFSSEPNVLQIAFRDGVTFDDFQNVWKSKLEASEPPLRLVGYAEVRTGMERSSSVASRRSQAWAATGMACLAAVFIIFSTLSMGVSERAREFAMLRAVALTRKQLAGVIALESVTLAILGWLGGLLAGWGLLFVGSRVLPGLFSSGAVLGAASVLLTGLAVMGGALGAAILPAWRAMRIKPIDAMSSRPHSLGFRRGAVLGVAGLLLATSAPLSVFVAPMPDDWRVWCYSTVTWPALLIGMVLLTPTMVWTCERVFGPLVTRLLGLDPRLAKTQLSSNMWRTVGAALSLSLGLALYASTQTWGYSMLQPFLPGDWLPDMIVAFHPLGLDQEAAEAVKRVPGVKADEVLPLAIEQARFDWGDREPPSRLRHDNAILFGLDPDRALGADNPFLKVEFVEGDRHTAAKALQAGGACIISQDFQMMTGVCLGDTLDFVPPHAPEKIVSYQVAAVVSLPGWPWFTKFSGVRRHFVRTATMMFVAESDVRRDFHLDRTEFFWLNLEQGASLSKVEAELQAIAERDAGETFQAEGYGEVKAYRPFARATATENVRKAITLRANDMIWGMSQLPLVTLVIMSLAVANAVIASVRARTWEFGVLRSVGITRSQLVRLILAETLMIGLVACVLSLTFGLIAGWCGVGMALYSGWFAGPSTFLIPWKQLSIGFSLTIILCLLAAVWPSIRAGCAEPLTLLRAGRGAI